MNNYPLIKQLPITLKKTSFLPFLFVIFFALPLSAQVPYTPFPKGGIEWQCSGQEYYADEIYNFVLSIDTALESIEGKIYHKIYFGNLNFPKYIGGIREEDRKIYLYLKYIFFQWTSDYESRELLIYDFNLDIGDTIVYPVFAYFNIAHLGDLQVSFYYPETDGKCFIYVVKDKDVITLENGEIRNTHIVDKYWYNNENNRHSFVEPLKWVEGLGALGGEGFLTPFYFPYLQETPLFLRCICQNHSMLYGGNNSDCFLQVNEKINRLFNIYPQPTIGDLTIENTQLLIVNVEIYDVYGRKQKTENKREKGERELVLDIAHLPNGLYFVKVFTENGVYVEKIIKK
ncbi:MAG: T9SS type A sorting domain-containing protein [Bacteroidales bacterium]|jgi:hypothetical protein|nr:T9SS type A sorting domain-containing protein [Bacteroidales bacterium]